jgi:predicted short-subunit dehydrogenase-like oxidoreductase (DUF2520 family)
LDVQSQPSISIVGAGNVGFHLAIALHDAGFLIHSIVSRTRRKAEETAGRTGARVADDLSERDHDPDMFLLCVPDDKVPHASEALAGTRAVVAHTSGSTGIDVLKEHGPRAGVLYPLQTFTRGADMEYSDIPFLVEAKSETTEKLLCMLAERISGKMRITDSSTRLHVHMAAVFACNFGNHMAAIAEKLLEETEIGFEILVPLLDQTYHKIRTMSPSEAQTGPAVRKDQGTMDKHLKALANHPELHELYLRISNHISRTEQKKNL